MPFAAMRNLPTRITNALWRSFWRRRGKNAPQLEQVVLRVGTVLGKGTSNQITDLFKKPRLLAVRGSESPFVFVWTRDLARILMRAATEGPSGIFNVAGDGALGVTELAQILNKPVRRLPAWALKAALRIARPLGLTQYGPEQVRFLQYRPVLSNSALKRDFWLHAGENQPRDF